jgi:hypothetical protein
MIMCSLKERGLMTTYHPRFGELLTSKEVTVLTGLTLNQLRNSRARNSGLPFVKQGGSCWYRRADVDAWVELNGGAQWEYVIPEGSIETPLENAEASGVRSEQLIKLAGITTRNSFTKWYTWLLEDTGFDYADIYGRVRDYQIEFHKELTGEDLTELFPTLVEFNLMRAKDPFRFWGAFTYAVRKVVAEVSGWDVSDAEVTGAPVGDVPPNKLD